MHDLPKERCGGFGDAGLHESVVLGACEEFLETNDAHDAKERRN
jgi:hypothetical protein